MYFVCVFFLVNKNIVVCGRVFSSCSAFQNVKNEISWVLAVKKCAARVDVSRARCVARF